MGVYSEMGTGPTRLQRLAVRAYKFAPARWAMQRLHGVARPRKWVFVVGCYNSGTTLLARLLGWHPNLSALPVEGASLTTHLPVPEQFGWTRMWCECLDKMAPPRRDGREIARRIMRDWAPFFDAKRDVFVEKSVANLTRMEWLDEHFDNTYFIGVLRNPYPVCEGIRRKARPAPPVRARFGASYPIALPAKQWAAAAERLHASCRNVRRAVTVRYEDLTTEPAAVLSGLFDFLGETTPGMSLDQRVFSISGTREKIVNMNDRSIARLSRDDIATINQVLGDKIADHGYNVLQSGGGDALADVA